MEPSVKIACSPRLFCHLCRENIPPPKFEGSVPRSSQWQYEILAIFCPTGQNEPLRTLAAVADFTDGPSLSRLLPFGNRQLHPFKLDLSKSSCAPSDRCGDPGHIPAHLVHVQCWKLARQRFTGSDLNGSIYRLARSTSGPLYDTKYHVDDDETYVSPEILDVGQIHTPQSLIGRLLKLLSRFPADVRLTILKECGKSPLSSALVVCTESLRLLQHLSSERGQLQRNSRPTHLQLCSLMPTPKLGPGGPSSVLTAQWISIYGHSYLSSLQETVLNSDKAPPDSLPLRPLVGVKFAHQSGGIRGLQLLYSDGTKSNWLGRPAGWFGVLRAENITDLKLQSDDLRYTNIDVEHNTCQEDDETLPWNPPQDLVMWKPDVTFSDSQENYLLQLSTNEVKIPHFPGWRLARYNSLVDKSGYVSGITIYCHDHGFSGIITHGKTDNLTGARIGCPIHLPLRTGERILSIWVHRPISMKEASDREPSLLMVTNFGRTCSFCPIPYPRSALLPEDGLHWTLLSEDISNPIIGLFHDPLAVSDTGNIMTFGITKEDKHLMDMEPLEEFPTPKIPRAKIPDGILRTESTSRFLTLASLSNITKIDIRRSEERCLGLWIQHGDGLVEILGQWDPSGSSEISELYQSSQGTLQKLIFFTQERFAEPSDERIFFNGRMQFCKEIQVGIGESPPTPVEVPGEDVFIVEDMNKTIAWWFSSESDCVVLWDGWYEEPPFADSEAREMDLFGGREEPLDRGDF